MYDFSSTRYACENSKALLIIFSKHLFSLSRVTSGINNAAQVISLFTRKQPFYLKFTQIYNTGPVNIIC